MANEFYLFHTCDSLQPGDIDYAPGLTFSFTDPSEDILNADYRMYGTKCWKLGGGRYVDITGSSLNNAIKNLLLHIYIPTSSDTTFSILNILDSGDSSLCNITYNANTGVLSVGSAYSAGSIIAESAYHAIQLIESGGSYTLKIDNVAIDLTGTQAVPTTAAKLRLGVSTTDSWYFDNIMSADITDTNPWEYRGFDHYVTEKVAPAQPLFDIIYWLTCDKDAYSGLIRQAHYPTNADPAGGKDYLNGSWLEYPRSAYNEYNIPKDNVSSSGVVTGSIGSLILASRTNTPSVDHCGYKIQGILNETLSEFTIATTFKETDNANNYSGSCLLWLVDEVSGKSIQLNKFGTSKGSWYIGLYVNNVLQANVARFTTLAKVCVNVNVSEDAITMQLNDSAPVVNALAEPLSFTSATYLKQWYGDNQYTYDGVWIQNTLISTNPDLDTYNTYFRGVRLCEQLEYPRLSAGEIDFMEYKTDFAARRSWGTLDKHTVLLIHADGEDIIDETGKTVTVNGKIFNVPASEDFSFGPDDFTIHWKMKYTSAGLFSWQALGNYAAQTNITLDYNDGYGYWLYWCGNGGNYIRGNNAAMSDGDLHHHAIVRHNGTIYYFLDGSILGSSTTNSAGQIGDSVNAVVFGNAALDAHVIDLEILKGVALWTDTFTPSDLNRKIALYSEDTIKTQGYYALKGVAIQTDSLNYIMSQDLTATPIDLSGINTVKFDIRSSRTGGNIKIGIHDSGGTITEITPNITAANTFQTVSWDISGVTDANKNAIDQILITIVNADAENTFYIDNFQTQENIFYHLMSAKNGTTRNLESEEAGFDLADVVHIDIYDQDVPPPSPPPYYHLMSVLNGTTRVMASQDLGFDLSDVVSIKIYDQLPDPEVPILTVYPEESILYLGDTVQFRAIATYLNGDVIDVTDLADYYNSSSPPIAEFSDEVKGLLKTLVVGSSTIIISYMDMEVEVPLLIHNPLIVAQDQDMVGRYQPTVETYLSLITSQYQNSPKFLEWVRTYLEVTNDIRELAVNLGYYFSFFNIISPTTSAAAVGREYIPNTLTVKQADFVFQVFDACEGVQLDILGVILGQSRSVYFKADDTMSPPEEAINYILEDDDYRLMLKNRVLINHWDGKASSLQVAWGSLFPGGSIIIQDNQNMTVDITITGALTDVIVRAIKNDYVVPRPQGVQYNYYYGDLPFFGFDRDDEYVSGFDIGKWTK